MSIIVNFCLCLVDISINLNNLRIHTIQQCRHVGTLVRAFAVDIAYFMYINFRYLSKSKLLICIHNFSFNSENRFIDQMFLFKNDLNQRHETLIFPSSSAISYRDTYNCSTTRCLKLFRSEWILFLKSRLI